MSGIVPKKGQYFTVRNTRCEEDRSWSDDIFKCIAVDNLVIATSPTEKCLGENRKFIFPLKDYAFYPVSCDVLNALDIEVCTSVKGFFKRFCC